MQAQMAAGVGWRDALRSGLFAQQTAKREEVVVKRIEKLADMPDFTFADLEQDMQEMLDEMNLGVMQKAQLFADRMSGGTTEETLERKKAEVVRRMRIIGEFNEHERRQPKLLTRKARNAIAQKLGVEVKWVEDAIFQYHLQYAQWTYLRREKLRNRPLPASGDELEEGLRLRPTRQFMDVMNMVRKLKQKLEEARPGYVEPPRDMHTFGKLKIRPYISSSRRRADRRKPPSKEHKRHPHESVLL